MVKIRKHFDYLTPFAEAESDEELATIMRLKYPKACSKLEVDAAFFADMVDGVREFEGWRVIGFDSFESFCQEKLGKTLDEVEAIVAGVKVLQASGIKRPTAAEAIKAAPPMQPTGRPKKGSQRPPLPKGSNSKDRLAARLKSEFPEIAMRVEAGEFKSVRAAAIEAGIVKVPTPDETAAKAFLKADNKLSVFRSIVPSLAPHERLAMREMLEEGTP